MDEVQGTDWGADQVAALVADYFEMLNLDLAGQAFNKAERNRHLQKLTGRSRDSIEFKHQNMSATLQRLGQPWIKGYKPLPNFQALLLDSVEIWLERNGAIELLDTSPKRHAFAESAILQIDRRPSVDAKTETNDRLERLIRKFDPAARDERNRKLGCMGEELVYHSEKSRLRLSGLDGLAEKVRWISKEDGDGAGFDILSFHSDGTERHLEVKSTLGGAKTPFFISRNELEYSREAPKQFELIRLHSAANDPRAFSIKPPLDGELDLIAQNYRASLSANQ